MKTYLSFALLLFSVNSFAQSFSATPSYTELNEKIIKPKCLQCHNDNYAARQVYLVTYDDLKTYAVAGDPEKSILHEVVSDKAFVRMPMGAAPLTKTEENYIKAWIKAGMPAD